MEDSDQPAAPSTSSGAKDAGKLLKFADFTLDQTTRRLFRYGEAQKIQNKPLRLLIYLLDHRSRLVRRDELLQKFWPRSSNDESLTRCVSTLRKVLGDLDEPYRFIETRWGEGYRFIAPVSETDEPEPIPPPIAIPLESKASDHGRGNRVSSLLLVSIAALVVATAGLGWLMFRPIESTPLASVSRLAVLPIAAAESDRVAAAELTQELTRTLARVEGVTVVAYGSASQFEAGSDPLEAGEQLGVDALLVSELSRSNSSALLRSELVSARDASLLWSFAGEPGDAGDGGDAQMRQLARAVSGRLWASLQLRDREEPVNPEARRLYLRGRYYWNQRSNVAIRAAIEAFDQALELEPDYVDALVGLADSWLLLPLYAAMPPGEAIPTARAAAERALAIDPSEARAHAVLGVVSMQYDWDWGKAEAYLHRALTLNLNDATSEQWLGEMHCYRGQFDLCRKRLAAAASLDPLSPVLRMLQGSPDLYAGNFESAVARYEAARAELPDLSFLQLSLGHAYVGLQDFDSAVASYRAVLPDLGLAIAGGPLIHALARRGDIEEASELLSALETLTGQRYVPPFKLAVAYLGLGDKERAIASLEQAVAARDDRLLYLAVDSVFFELHDDPAFRAIARRLDLEPVLR